MAENDDLLQQALAVNPLTATGAQATPILNLRYLQNADWDISKVRLARLADRQHFEDLMRLTKPSDQVRCEDG